MSDRALVVLRHGESIWNRENRFTGWTDIDLSAAGIDEARRATESLSRSGFAFDVAFTSVLKRAIRTLWIVLDGMDRMWIPVHRSWRLNERHYGALQGLDKAETAARYGEEQVHAWRRGYALRPPALDPADPRSPVLDPRYAGVPRQDLPLTEALSDTVARFLPCWHGQVVPELRAGKSVLLVAHGNILRALMKHLGNLSDEEIAGHVVPTGVPLVYELNKELRPVKQYYLGEPEKVERAVAAAAGQGGGTGSADEAET